MSLLNGLRLLGVTLGLVGLGFGCGDQVRPVENYNIASIGDLTLSASNHPHGYGKSTCFSCHVPANIHRVDRLGAPSFSLAAPLVDSQGLASCSGCHGANGVL